MGKGIGCGGRACRHPADDVECLCDHERIPGVSTFEGLACNDPLQDFSKGVEIMKKSKIAQVDGKDVINGGHVKSLIPRYSPLIRVYRRLPPRWSETGPRRSSSEAENLRLDSCSPRIVHDCTVLDNLPGLHGRPRRRH